MHDIEDQLRRYGDAIERHLIGAAEPVIGAPAEREVRRSWRFALVATAVLVAVVATTVIVTRTVSDPTTVSTRPGPPANSTGVFTTPTGTVLLFSDGIDGVTAIDLDRRIAGRRVIDGERAGDQPFRLTLTGEQLIVGWGTVYAAPLTGGASHAIADATIFVPAAEPGEVWTITWDGGRIGVGTDTVRRVRTDGAVTFETRELDTSKLDPVLGVPGGLLVNRPTGVAIWDANSGRISDLGPGRAATAASDGRSVAWCDQTCAQVRTAALDRTGAPTARHVAPGNQQLAFSPSGAHLAVLRPIGTQAELRVRDTPDGTDRVVAQGLDPNGALSWSPDGRQVFYTQSSYRQPTMTIGRFAIDTGTWETRTLNVGDGIAPIATTRDEARSFFATDSSRADCPGANGTFPSNRKGTCSFAFSSPDTAQQCTVGESDGAVRSPHPGRRDGDSGREDHHLAGVAHHGVVADLGGGVHGRFNVTVFQNLALSLCVVGPDTGKAVGLQFEPHADRVEFGLADTAAQ